MEIILTISSQLVESVTSLLGRIIVFSLRTLVTMAYIRSRKHGSQTTIIIPSLQSVPASETSPQAFYEEETEEVTSVTIKRILRSMSSNNDQAKKMYVNSPNSNGVKVQSIDSSKTTISTSNGVIPSSTSMISVIQSSTNVISSSRSVSGSSTSDIRSSSNLTEEPSSNNGKSTVVSWTASVSRELAESKPTTSLLNKSNSKPAIVVLSGEKAKSVTRENSAETALKNKTPNTTSMFAGSKPSLSVLVSTKAVERKETSLAEAECQAPKVNPLSDKPSILVKEPCPSTTIHHRPVNCCSTEPVKTNHRYLSSINGVNAQTILTKGTKITDRPKAGAKRRLDYQHPHPAQQQALPFHYQPPVKVVKQFSQIAKSASTPTSHFRPIERPSVVQGSLANSTAPTRPLFTSARPQPKVDQLAPRTTLSSCTSVTSSSLLPVFTSGPIQQKNKQLTNLLPASRAFSASKHLPGPSTSTPSKSSCLAVNRLPSSAFKPVARSAVKATTRATPSFTNAAPRKYTPKRPQNLTPYQPMPGSETVPCNIDTFEDLAIFKTDITHYINTTEDLPEEVRKEMLENLSQSYKDIVLQSNSHLFTLHDRLKPMKPYLISGWISPAYLRALNNKSQIIGEMSDNTLDNHGEINKEIVSNCRTNTPAIFARDLFFRMFTLEELNHMNLSNLSQNKLGAIKRCVRKQFPDTMDKKMWQTKCLPIIRSSVRVLFLHRVRYVQKFWMREGMS